MDRERSDTVSRVAVLGLGEKATMSLPHLQQAAALIAMRDGCDIQFVVGQYRELTCDGLLLLDGIDGSESALPTLTLDTSVSAEATAEALGKFVPKLIATREARNSRLREMRKRSAGETLTVAELKALEEAQETWEWSDEETELIMARGARKSWENAELLAANQPSRDSRKGRIGWLRVREEMCNELGD